MKRQVCLLCVALLMLPIGSVRAGEPYDPGRIYDPPRTYHPRGSPTLVGQYVRVNNGMKWEYGTVRSVNRDSLVLRQKSPDGLEVRLAIPQSSVHYMQVRTSGKRHGDQGALIGAVAGLVVGVAVGVAAIGGDPEGTFAPDLSQIGLPVLGGVIGTCLGALVGGVIGLAVKTDQWGGVNVGPVAIDVAPRPSSQLALGITVPF